MKRTRLVGLVIVILILGYELFRLGIGLGVWQPVFRPKEVPRSARYVSLVEDAAWFDCALYENRDVDHCRVWTPSGRLICDCDFRLEDTHHAAPSSELRPSRLLLRDGRHPYMLYLFGSNGTFSRILVPVNCVGPSAMSR